MKLNNLEFFFVNSPIRAYVQEKYELPILINMLTSKTFDSVLEIGCGIGNGTKLIKKYFNPIHITAIDLDEKMIQIAKRTIQDETTTFKIMPHFFLVAGVPSKAHEKTDTAGTENHTADFQNSDFR